MHWTLPKQVIGFFKVVSTYRLSVMAYDRNYATECYGNQWGIKVLRLLKYFVLFVSLYTYTYIMDRNYLLKVLLNHHNIMVVLLQGACIYSVLTQNLVINETTIDVAN